MAGSRPAAGSSMGFLSHDGQDKEARGKETDDRQADEPEVTFYTHGLCPYAQRVAITLEAKAADVSGQVVTESIDICRFLDERYPKVPLVPSEAQSSRAMDRLVSKADSIIHAGLAMVAGSERLNGCWGLAMVAGSERLWAIDTKRGSRGGGNARVQGEWIKALDSLQEAVRQSQGPFLTGADLSLADVVLFPFLARFQLVAEGIRGEPFSPDHPLVTQWMAAMWQQPSARRTFPDRDRFLLALKQYASLDYFDFHSTSLEDPVPKYWV
ncbi:unnamed protein product [Closterium sp. NIES-65]|nr:unnamed protein product [Closterium sp. NIES-65]CAI6012615.1 unnamed protein product [Closterium sp. NIES-65]